MFDEVSTGRSVEPAARNLRRVNRDPVLALPRRQGLHLALAEGLGVQILSCGDLTRHPFQHHAPANPGYRISGVNLEGDVNSRRTLEPGQRPGSKHNDRSFGRVAHGEDINFPVDLEREPAKVARVQIPEALMKREHLQPLSLAR